MFRIEVSQIEFPFLQTQDDWNKGKIGTPAELIDSQSHCVAADHLVLIYPLWLGTMPAILKAFLEQVFRPGVALSNEGKFPRPLFKGKTARVLVTMGMPAMAYRWFYGAHSLKSLERNILKFCGIKPVRESIIGMVGNSSENVSKKWLDTMQRLGANCK